VTAFVPFLLLISEYKSEVLI